MLKAGAEPVGDPGGGGVSVGPPPQKRKEINALFLTCESSVTSWIDD